MNLRDKYVTVGQSIAFTMDNAIIIIKAVLKSGIVIPPSVWVIAKKRLTSKIRKTISFIACLMSFLSLLIILLPACLS